MRRALAATLLLLVGGALIRLFVSGEYLRYTKDTMALPILLAGAAICVLGFAGWWLATSSSTPRPAGSAAAVPGGHDHGAHLPAVAWLLLLPVLAVYLAPPPALGADAVLRESTRAVGPASELFEPLPAGDPLILAPRDAVERVLYDPQSGILDREVRVDGFAVPLEGEDGWYVARISLACCAADGVAYRVLVSGVPAPGADEWISVTGRLSPPGETTEGLPIPRLAATSVAPYTVPENPYD